MAKRKMDPIAKAVIGVIAAILALVAAWQTGFIGGNETADEPAVIEEVVTDEG